MILPYEVRPDCPKCGAILAAEVIEGEVDVFCMSCGWRKVAVARVRLVRSEIVRMGPDETPPPDATAQQVSMRECQQCGQCTLA